jgi:hippurate hydrolase
MTPPNHTLHLPSPLRSLFADELQQRLVSLRRDLHRQPELSFQEERTASRLFDELAMLHPAGLERISTAVVARIAGRNSNVPPVAIRADIDALPLQEATGLEYSSVNPGVMHACGHDVHAAWGIGAAHLLSARPAEGEVIVFFQPAEEIGKGALAMLETGVLNRVAAIFGAHVDRRYPVGTVIAQEGPLAASADTFEVEVIGRGAHGARPQEAADPIVASAAIVLALQTIVSRRLNPANAGVVTVGTVHSGSAPNIIPERAKLTGTLRAVDPETRKLLQDELKTIAESVASAHRVQAKVSIEHGTPPVVNPHMPVQWAKEAVTSLLGAEAIVPMSTLNMAGEDFAYYLEKIPGCFLRIGACEEGGKPIPSHSPFFYAAEESIFVGAAVLAETARVASSRLRSNR